MGETCIDLWNAQPAGCTGKNGRAWTRRGHHTKD
jgi:hypothetical protein